MSRFERRWALAVLLLGILGVPALAQTLQAKWAMSGSDLVTWDVYEPPANEGGEERLRDRSLSLALYGYQVDRRGTVHFPAHLLEDVAYDLALQVPLGKISAGKRHKLQRTYDELPGHFPLQVTMEGEIVQIFDKSFRWKARVTGAAQPAFDAQGFPAVSNRFSHFSGKVEVVFDTAQGLVTSSTVQIESTLFQRSAQDDAEPKKNSFDYRFALRRFREHHPRRLDSPVGGAIESGVEWLRAQVGKDGLYAAHGAEYLSGETCLAALTLLICGADREDPFIRDLMGKVRAFEPRNTYEVGISLMAMEAYYAPADEVAEVHAGRRNLPERRKLSRPDRIWMQERVGWLLSLAETTSDGIAWGYRPESARADLSNTQYAALGLLSAWRCGVKVHEDVWVELGKRVFSFRPPSDERTLLDLELVTERERSTSAGRRVIARGFGYTPGTKDANASMTTAGLTTLRIVRDVLRAMKSRHTRGRLGKEIGGALASGWAWLGRDWIIQRQAPDRGRAWHLYYLYGLERAAVLCNVRKVNGRDWYFEGAAWLVESQAEDGHWKSLGAGGIHETCFALLFLKRGTIPVSTGE